MTLTNSPMKVGQHIKITDASHPHAEKTGKLAAYQPLPVIGFRWRIKLAGGGECFAKPDQLKKI